MLSCLEMGTRGWSGMPETSKDEYNVAKMYNRKQEKLAIVEHYERMRELGCFTLQDITEMVGERSAVTYLVNDYQRKGYIDRIHRNLYTVMDTEREEPMLTRYQIGSRLFPDAYIALRSAFEVWGYAPRRGNEVFVATGTRFTDFRYNGVFYRRVHPKTKASTEWVAGALVTSLEQTVVDSLHSYEGSRGLEDVVECIVRLPKLDADKLLGCLEKYGNGYLYQKCGYVLEQLQEYVGLPEAFYRECRAHCASTVRYMVKGAENLVYNRAWGIYGPCLDCRKR
jgi:predicted transcriptional regulator of viral defense system